MKEQWAKDLIVRGEKQADFAEIEEINRLAFGREDEGKLINDIRKTRNYEFGFSLVAVKEEKIQGHALFSKAFVVHKGRRFKCLALGPIAVLPEFQRKGVGTALINEGLERAKEVGFGAVVVLGDPVYYERFGFKSSTGYKIRCTFCDNPANFLVKEISRNSLRGIIGTVHFAKEFLTLAAEDKKRTEAAKIAEEKALAEVQPAVNEETEHTERVNENTKPVEQGEQKYDLPSNEQEPALPENVKTGGKPGINPGEIESLI